MEELLLSPTKIIEICLQFLRSNICVTLPTKLRATENAKASCKYSFKAASEDVASQHQKAQRDII